MSPTPINFRMAPKRVEPRIVPKCAGAAAMTLGQRGTSSAGCGLIAAKVMPLAVRCEFEDAPPVFRFPRKVGVGYQRGPSQNIELVVASMSEGTPSSAFLSGGDKQ